jgi:hypothetical protein
MNTIKNKVMNNKFDIKNIFIFVLSLIIVLILIFHDNLTKKSDNNLIEQENKLLEAEIDSLKKINKINEEKLIKLNTKADSLILKLNESEKKIKFLIKKRNEIPKTINNLSANDVASSLSDFIESTSR